MCCINKLVLHTFQWYPHHSMETDVIEDQCNLFYCLSHVKYTFGVDYFIECSLTLSHSATSTHPHTSQRHSCRRTEFSTCCQFTFCSHCFTHKVMTSPPQNVCKSKWSIGYMIEMLQLFGQISFHISGWLMRTLCTGRRTDSDNISHQEILCSGLVLATLGSSAASSLPLQLKHKEYLRTQLQLLLEHV